MGNRNAKKSKQNILEGGNMSPKSWWSLEGWQGQCYVEEEAGGSGLRWSGGEAAFLLVIVGKHCRLGRRWVWQEASSRRIRECWPSRGAWNGKDGSSMWEILSLISWSVNKQNLPGKTVKREQGLWLEGVAHLNPDGYIIIFLELQTLRATNRPC